MIDALPIQHYDCKKGCVKNPEGNIGIIMIIRDDKQEIIEAMDYWDSMDILKGTYQQMWGFNKQL